MGVNNKKDRKYKKKWLINSYIKEIESFQSDNHNEIDKFRIKFLSKKGIIADLFEQLKNIPPEQKKAIGQQINTLKNKALDKIDILKIEKYFSGGPVAYREK